MGGIGERKRKKREERKNGKSTPISFIFTCCHVDKEERERGEEKNLSFFLFSQPGPGQ